MRGPLNRGHLTNPMIIAHYEYMTLARKTSVLREAMLLFVEPARSAVNRGKIVPRILCGHILKLCLNNYFILAICSQFTRV